MSTFKTFLVEQSSRMQETSVEDAASFIKRYCSRYIANGNWIYRGTQQEIEFAYADPTTSERVSAYVPNYYTLILDNLSSWDKFPKRSRSFICTTSQWVASEFGHESIVFIPDSAKVGILGDEDIQMSGSFPQLDEEFDLTIEQFARMFERIHQLIEPNITLNQIEKSFESLKQFLREAATKVDHVANKDKRIFRFLSMIDQYGVDQTLNQLLGPEANNVQLTTGAQMSNLTNAREVWFSSPCIMAYIANNEQQPIPERLLKELK